MAAKAHGLNAVSYTHLDVYKRQKLVVVPAIFLPIAAAIGFRGQDMAVLISLYCSPVAVSSFVMAQQMDSDGDLAGQFVVLGAALSVVTIFLWVFLFKNLGLL